MSILGMGSLIRPCRLCQGRAQIYSTDSKVALDRARELGWRNPKIFLGKPMRLDLPAEYRDRVMYRVDCPNCHGEGIEQLLNHNSATRAPFLRRTWNWMKAQIQRFE